MPVANRGRGRGRGRGGRGGRGRGTGEEGQKDQATAGIKVVCKRPIPSVETLPPPEPKKQRILSMFKEDGTLCDGMVLMPLKARHMFRALQDFRKEEERRTTNRRELEVGFKNHEAKLQAWRLKLLREGDDEAYKAMLENSRDDRYKAIADRTDEILTQLGITKDNTNVPLLPQPKEFVGVVLKPYQLEGVSWLYCNYTKGVNCVLADEMGLGKTAQTIALMCQIDTKARNLKHLVVAPLSTLDNWVAELDRMAPHLEVVKYHGPRAIREGLTSKIKKGRFDVVVTQYTTLQNVRLVDMLKTLQKVQWEYIIVDEGHKLNNTQTAFSKSIRSFFSGKRLLLTGTPLQNDVHELWCLLNFLMPTMFPKSVSFDEWFTVDKKAQTEEEKLLLARRLHGLLRPFLLRREKADVLSQLPSKRVFTIHAPLSPMQHSLYTQAVEHKVIGPVMDEDTVRPEPASYMTLRKVCNHPYLVLPGRIPLAFYNEHLVSSSGKLELLRRILARVCATGHKCLIFTQFVSVLNLLEDFFASLGWGPNAFCRIDGAVALDERKADIQRFQTSGECKAFILSTRAGGQGINLQAADTVIFFDMDWNPQQDLQAIARAHRLGQTNEVRIFKLLTDAPVEKHMHNVSEDKMEYEALAIGAGMYDQRSTLMQRDQRMKEVLQMHIDSVARITSNEQLNAMLARSEEEAALFATLEDNGQGLMEEVPKSFIEAQERAVKKKLDSRPLTFEEMAQVKLPPRQSRRTQNEAYPGLSFVENIQDLEGMSDASSSDSSSRDSE
eukprot:TRINITY_DN9171_c0_g1_i1.p1 TRINITY_DN9171_c0_g1~~TRINITY_DN9171_c0_g1_i1.p1  ORF type:complete len:781 (+),score=261.18 TRINITY_DN9171_c0_g1_i1:45-2387(+)